MIKRRIILILLAAVAISAGCSRDKSSAQKEPTAVDSTVKAPPRDSTRVELTGRDSVSVLQLLQEAHEVEIVESAMGTFVKRIDSLANGENLFWVYSVNDSMGQTASNKYITKDSDRVIWHYRIFGSD